MPLIDPAKRDAQRGVMAGGWTKEGAVQEPVDNTVNDAVNIVRARLGVRLCVLCQQSRE